ncbi:MULTISPECIES: sigma 54-interacting transcriptional regulator [environmental samples]|uniref:sigma 54-interacting transcriptional regulator n=1 Tax=environmental samples TaxID=876090 RepID=UPI00033BE684|nr:MULTISPECIES: sigma 54-interacting transcriptional regulator [environmental samples]CDC73447.1 putative uncharacterized protein [Oscillibacter sp. CAG:155]
MVNVMVFAPSPDLMEPMRKLAQEYGSDEVNIDVIHRFGTPEILWQLDRYDVIVARGITYNKIRDLYPQKHITQLVFDGLDVLEALRRCRETYHPAHLGLCLDRDQLQDLVPAMEEVCGAKIRIYDVQDEETAIRTAETCQADGMDALVSGGTVYNFCQERGVPCTYVHLRMETLRRTLSEAMKAAHSINTERTKSNIIRMILDNSEDAVMAVDESGRVLEANNQAYRLYHLAFLKEWKGQSVEKINDALTFIGSRKSPCRDGDEELVTLDGQRYMVKYRLISGETSAIGTLITTSAASKILQEERQIRRGLVRRGLAAKYSFRDIIAVSDSMRSRVEIAKQFSQANNSNVLITGETGTGKELFAHSIHAASGRNSQPFVAVNCATLPGNLLESELFGYEPGAFSGASREGKVGLFEQAHRGTIFLDEIGEIPVSLQAKLLRVLQEKEIRRVGSTTVIPVDVRVIAATNLDLQQQIAKGRFRSDLLYRLNALEIHIPPLRERPADILPLLEHQMCILSAELGKAAPALTADAREVLCRYDWPGNVRELRNVCERLVVLSNGRPVDAAYLRELHMFQERPAAAPAGTVLSAPGGTTLVLPPTIRKKDLAKELGVSRTTLWRMTKRQEEAARKQRESTTES